jgi:hypothetical protein
MMNDIERRARQYEPISIVECERLAQDKGHDSTTFLLVGPFGIKEAKWLDAYFGFLTFDGLPEGKMANTSQLEEVAGLVCLRVQWPDMEKVDE